MPAAALRLPLAHVRLGRLGDNRLAALCAEGDERAFEALYDRHHRALLGFCRHMLGSQDEGEDALQQTFLCAHRALLSSGCPDELRPWLFAIARNRCRTLLAARSKAAASDEQREPATEGLGAAVERRADLRALLADIDRLPEDQRAALVLAELADLPHSEAAAVIGVPATKVKALVHQARSRLIAEREARETPCEQVREQLAVARGGQLRRGPLRRHLAVCAPCGAYKSAVAEQRRALALVLPVLPSVGLKGTILGGIAGGGGCGAAAAVGAAACGSALPGTAGLAAKLAVGAALAGGAGGGAIVVKDAATPPDRAASAVRAPAKVLGAPAGRGPLRAAPPATGTRTAGEPSTGRRSDETARGPAAARRRDAGKRRARGQALREGAAQRPAQKRAGSDRAAERAAANEQRRALRVSPTEPSPPAQAPRGRAVVETARPFPPRRDAVRGEKVVAPPPPALSPAASRRAAAKDHSATVP